VSGETEANISGWTVDTLREHLTRQITAGHDTLRQRLDDTREYARLQFTDQQASIARQFDGMRDSTRLQVADMRVLLDERYATQVKALDAAFKAAEQAVTVALANAEKATAKAEMASDKRFDAVNEFRKALTDQTATFLPRAEYDTAHAALADRLTVTADRVSALELRLTSRLDRGEGTDAGAAGQRNEARLNMGTVVSVALLALSVVTFIFLYVAKR
jgi:hypothetical protein